MCVCSIRVVDLVIFGAGCRSELVAFPMVAKISGLDSHNVVASHIPDPLTCMLLFTLWLNTCL